MNCYQSILLFFEENYYIGQPSWFPSSLLLNFLSLLLLHFFYSLLPRSFLSCQLLELCNLGPRVTTWKCFSLGSLTIVESKLVSPHCYLSTSRVWCHGVGIIVHNTSDMTRLSGRGLLLAQDVTNARMLCQERHNLQHRISTQPFKRYFNEQPASHINEPGTKKWPLFCLLCMYCLQHSHKHVHNHPNSKSPS